MKEKTSKVKPDRYSLIKKWLLNILYLVIALITFSLSIFKMDNHVWFAAWIAPIFLIRYMRINKWTNAVILCTTIITLAYFSGLLPFYAEMDTGGGLGDLNTLQIFRLFILPLSTVPLFIMPFILDKAYFNKLPKLAGTLIFPSGIVVVELVSSYIQGIFYSFGQTQLALPPMVVLTSIFGTFGLSFFITWTASLINNLWEEQWDLKKLGFSSICYLSLTFILLMYGGLSVVFRKQVKVSIPVAGITMETGYEKRILSSDFRFVNHPEIESNEYTEQLRSPISHMNEMYLKTKKAIKTGAKIIIWQEYALTMEASVADSYLKELKELADKEDVYILAGYARLLSKNEKTKDKIMKNIGILFTPDGKTGWEYEKGYPTSGEYLFCNAGSREIPYIDTPYGRIGQVICYDMHFPHYLRQTTIKKIDLLISQSYDAPTWTPLHSFNNGYRAVENGFTMVRIVGDGHSAVIDPYYFHWGGKNTFQQGTNNFYFNVPVISRNTIYGYFGYVFPYVVAFLLLLLVILYPFKFRDIIKINNYKKR
jgi:apolipoprotein N-acyltransferase